MTMDKNGVLYLSEGLYSLVLRLNANGTIQRVAGNTAATNIGDGGPALESSLIGGQGFSPGAVAFDPSGNMFIPEPGINLIREVSKTPYQPLLSPDHIDAMKAATQRIAISANIAEPFPYQVRVSTTDGGSWLTASRATGITGESITVNINPAGLAPGSYRGTVSILVSVPIGGTPIEADVPVSLTLM